MNAMARHIKARKFYPTIAIIGEGIVEQIYFKQLRQTEQVNFTVKPDLPKYPSAQSIVEKANELLNKEFDTAFCIFDLDQINRNRQTREQYERLKRENQRRNLIFIENNPCMEFWFLLHYEHTNRKFASSSQLIKALEKHIAAYEKTAKFLEGKKIYTLLKPDQPRAHHNASLTDTPENQGSRSQVYKILDFLNVTE
jgi:hypothetical protein